MSRNRRHSSHQAARRQGPATEARQPAPPRPRTQPGFWRGPWPLVLAGLVVVAAVAAIWLLGQRGPAAAPPAQAATVVQQVTSVPPSVFSAVGTGGLKNPLKPTGAAAPGGTPVVIYVGAEYCPFCAAERWSVVVALSRFGTFSNLTTSSSSSTDAYPDTPTFTFKGSGYTSQYLQFSAGELSDRQQRPLATPDPAQARAISLYDPAGSIPFLDLGGRYSAVGAGFTPDRLGGSDWAAIAAALKDPNQGSTQAIVGNANYLVAAICRLTADQPATVCADPALQKIEAGLGG